MTRQRTIGIVGAGLAGLSAAETLRRSGFDGRLVLISDELHLPYSRPPLSKEMLRKENDDENVFFHSESWYSDCS